MKKITINLMPLVLFFACFLFIPTSQAVVVTELYEAEVPVSNQSGSHRKKNMAAVLRVVLIKLTGDSQVPSRSGMPELLNDADKYVQQFEYRTTETDGVSQLTLWARFNKNSLDKILQDAAIPEWGRERPTTLVWLAVGDTGGRRLTGLNDTLGYTEFMEKQAKNRGIVLVHPLLDLLDTNQLSASDIWAGFQEPVLEASKRYHADAVLAVKIESITPDLWEANWSAYINDETFTWVTQGMLPETILLEGTDGLANVLAEQYGQAGTYTQVGEFEILVNDISDYNQYAKVLYYLESLNAVTNVDVREVNTNSVSYVLTVQGDATIIGKAVNLGQTLEQINTTSYRLIK